ncbi:MAG TPA: histidinol-phosphate transaminase [Porphyromonadaceae bacterium]|jgi:histidinol-phosphate aminotransferase|nr:histidinol-phosphate transaminase [Porphyromonadaceae bacterium]HBK31825.1 histidinol-phosphate transaminase [Porphyromonadaceae bacterium]HCM20718.1 histidinol-phosphate transaminase [Porphyromonadaceae bacterium]
MKRTFEWTKAVRPNILALHPYSSARDEFTGEEGIFLDANENPFGEYNRYPDPHQKALKQALSEVKGVPAGQLFIGNGSDEIIDLVYRIFCEPGKDSVIICPPTYGMYEVAANINDVAIRRIPLTASFQLNADAILQTAQTDPSVKLLFLCSPNNPTGNGLNGVEEVIRAFPGIVVVDEAYIDFYPGRSLKNRTAAHPNLIVMQTFSKAWALASARVGIAFAQERLIALMDKTKPPYNVSRLNQEAALAALSHPEAFEERLSVILEQKERLLHELSRIGIVKKIYPSDANFLLVEVDDANRVYDRLVEKKVIVRNRHSQVPGCIRITVGSPEENDKLLKELEMMC